MMANLPLTKIQSREEVAVLTVVNPMYLLFHTTFIGCFVDFSESISSNDGELVFLTPFYYPSHSIRNLQLHAPSLSF